MQAPNHKSQITNGGFTVYFAMLVAALALSIGFAIYDLTAREIDLSDTATQSQYAIYAADTGAECVLYWDSKYTPAINGASSAFGTSSASTWASSGVTCAGQDISLNGTPPTTYVVPANSGNGWTAWCFNNSTNCPTSVSASSTGAITTFTLVLGSAQNSACAIVQVEKYTSGGALYTSVTSSGYNNCATAGLRVQRTLQVSY
jgi:hypothetical protein